MTIRIKRLAAACLLASAFTMPGFAQDKHDDHTGHNHDQDIISTAPKAAITHVYDAAPDDHVVGEADAATTLIVYASVTCPHCSEWFKNEWPKIKTDLVETGKVKMVMREFPTEPGRMAMTGFILANCAPDDGFIPHIEYQMDIQKELFERLQAGDGKEAYAEMAAKAGMDSEEEMTECFKNEDAFNHIIASMDRAEAAEIQGVPAFFINGEEFDQKTTVYDALAAQSDAGVSKSDK